jgi:hypothetical protein
MPEQEHVNSDATTTTTSKQASNNNLVPKTKDKNKNNQKMKCSNSSTSLTCFYGTCQDDGTCKCSDGWQYDTYFFHDTQCTVPNGSYLALMILSLLLHYGCALYIIMKRKQTKSTVRLAFNFAIAFAVFQPIQNVGIYVQNGTYEMATIFTGLAATIAGVWAWSVLKLVVVPLFSLGNMKNHVQRIFFTNCVLTSIAFAGTILVMTGTCRMDSEIYNIAVISQLLTGFLFSSLFSISYIVEATQFLKQVTPIFANTVENNKSETSVENAKNVINKVRDLRKQMIMLMINMTVTLLPWIICHLVLSASPFSWCFFAVASFGNVTQITQITIALTSRKVDTSSSTSPRSGGLRKGGGNNNGTASRIVSTSPTSDGVAA